MHPIPGIALRRKAQIGDFDARDATTKLMQDCSDFGRVLQASVVVVRPNDAFPPRELRPIGIRGA